MNKMKIVSLLVAMFLTGGTAGGVIAYSILPSDKSVSVADSEEIPDPSRSDINIDKGDGLGLTPPEMLEELQLMEPGKDFDHRYLNYITLMRNNEIGMARVASRKAERQELKDVAAEQIEDNGAMVNQMYSWTKLWGFTHH